MKKAVIVTMFILLGAMLPGMTVHAEPEDGVGETGDGTSDGAYLTDYDSDSDYESDDSYDTGMDYTGPVDIVTGDPIYEDSDSGSSSSQSSSSAGGPVYDSFSGKFLYYVDGGVILSSAADGMVVTETVQLLTNGDTNLKLYQDGEAWSKFPEKIDEPGSYVIVTWTDNSETQVLSFTIVNWVTGKLDQYVMPEGFAITEVIKDTEKIPHGTGVVDLKEEGDYTITYVCSANSKEYELEITVDHTPPNVIFEGLDEDSEARGPVTLVGLEDGDKVTVMFEDEPAELDKENTVSEVGLYHVIVTDQAGNRTEKNFRIRLYLNISAAIFVVVVLAVIAGVAIALVISRKKLRVR